MEKSRIAKMWSMFLIVLSVSVCSSIAENHKIQPIKHYEPKPVHHLQYDLNEFFDIIPVDEIKNLTIYFYTNDEKMRESYDFMKNEGFSEMKRQLSELTIMDKLSQFFNESGVNLDRIDKRLSGLTLSDEEITSLNVTGEPQNLGGMNGFFEEAVSLVPQDEVISLFFDKLEKSNDFSVFFERVGSEDFENLMDKLKKSNSVQAFYFNLRANGIDLMKWLSVMKSFFGF